jgi:hypothetical protein
MNPLDEKANTLSRCGSFYYRTLVDESKADAEFVSHLSSYTRLTSLGEKISTAVQGGCYYKDLYKLIKFTDDDVDWNGIKQALQQRINGGAGVITEKLEQISVSNAKELGTQAWELSVDDVPAGVKQVTKVKMQVINTAPVTDPLYLQVFHATPDAAPILLAASENTVELEAGNYATWDFSLLLLGTEFLNNGGNLMFQFATVADAAWQSNAAIPYSRTVGVGAYVPSVQFWRNVAPEQSLPTYNRPARLTIKDHLFVTDDKWNWVSREGTPQPIAFPGANGDIILSDTQELIWDLHIDQDIMVTSIQMEDGTILYANQDFASQFGKLTFLQNPIAMFPTMQFMARSYIGRMPNLYNYLVHADSVYGSISRMLRYARGSQSIKSLYYASAQAAGLAVVDQDCTVVAVSPLLDGKAYITTAGRYDAAYPHTPLKPGAKLAKNYIIGGNQLYRLIGPYDPMPSNITGINLGTALPVPGLFAPNREIEITDSNGNYRPCYDGDSSAIKAYHRYLAKTNNVVDAPNTKMNGMQHFRYVACPNRCVVACINESYMTAQMKLRLMTYLQRELPIGSVLVTANLPNIINETPELTNKDIMDNFNILPFLHLDDRHYVKTNLVFDTAYSYDIEVKAYYGQFTPRYANVLGGVNVPTDGVDGYTPARCIGGASTYGFTYNKNYQLLITRPADAVEAGNELVYRMTQKTDDITTIEIGDKTFNLGAGTLQLVDAASPYLPDKGGVPEEKTYWIGMLHSAEGVSGFRSNAYHLYWKFIDPATNEVVLDLIPVEHKLTKQQGFIDTLSKTFYPRVSITED